MTTPSLTPAAPRTTASTAAILRRLRWPLLLLVPALALGMITLRTAYGPRNFYDFHIFWQAGRDVLAGRSPYPPATHAALVHQNRFVYPMPAAVAMVPLALLPLGVAASVFIAVSCAAIPAALLLLGVRDWRCHALTFCSIAVLQSVVLGTVTSLLLLAVAVAWRWRHRTLIAAAAVASVVMLKLFLVPLVVWLWACGRRTAAVAAVAITAAGTLAAWALIGFRGFETYPHLLTAVSQVEQRFGYSTIAFGSALGIPTQAGRVASMAIAATICVSALWTSRRHRDDRRALTLTLLAGLVLSPIVWLNYFLLLAAPIALVRQRLTPIWLIMLTPWLFANANSQAPAWKILLWQAGVAGVAVLTLSARWHAATHSSPPAAASATAAT